MTEPTTSLPLPPEPIAPDPSLPPPRRKKLLLIAGGSLLLLLLIGTAVRFLRPAALPIDPSPSPSPTASPSPAQDTKTMDLRLDQLTIPYPSNWLLLFAPVIDVKTPELTTIYFTRSQEEYRQHASCASTASCTTTPLAVSYTGSTIWSGYSLTDFLQTTKPDYPLSKLEDTTFGSHRGLSGYTDLAKLNYQAIILTGDNTYQTLFIKSRDDTRDMLQTFIDSLQGLTLLPAQANALNLLEPKSAYTLKLSARLETGSASEYRIFKSILNNLLEPARSELNPAYFLYHEGGATTPANYLDYTYYLITDNPELSPGKYESAQVSATLSPPPKEDFVPYLENSKYCRETSDCVYRAENCRYDAYNRYTAFTPDPSCQAVTYHALGEYLELMKSLKCSIATKTLSITYDSLECADNQCVALNPTPACIKK